MNSEQERAELLPCPFCGPGESVVSVYVDDVAQRYRVGCGRCGASTGIHPNDKTEAPAIAAWNRRAALQSQDREDSALTGTLREAAQIIAAIPPEHAPQNIRWPIVDELEGFALRIDHARRIEGQT